MKKIHQRWAGQTVIIAASGFSMKGSVQDLVDARLSNIPFALIAVNNTYELLPFADVLYAGDLTWWRAYHKEVATRKFQGEKWSGHQTISQLFHTSYVRCIHRTGLGTGDTIYANGNSGFQAINLAYLFGSRRILLVGFDMKPGPKGEKHWHKDHPKHMVQGQVFREWVFKAATLAKDLKHHGCEVINCTTDTALTCWPRSSLKKELGL